MSEQLSPNEPAFSDMLLLLMTMVQAQAGRKIPEGQEWQHDRQTLAKKLAYHLHTIKAIGNGSMLVIDGVSAPIVDHGSIKVLVRAILENYIVFAFIYGSADPEESRFRHMTWKFAGLMDRQSRSQITGRFREKLAHEKQLANDLKLEIEGSPFFLALTNKQRKALINGDWSAGKPWIELADSVGLDRRYFRNIYGYLCDYSHSSYAAALQVGDAKSIEDQRDNSSSMFGVANIVMAHFIVIYAKCFESASELLNQSSVKQTVQTWHFTAENFNSIYGTGSTP